MTDRLLTVDHALSTEGFFPLSQGDIIVEILTPFDWQIVVVSDRYTAGDQLFNHAARRWPGAPRRPVDIAEAAVIAVDAYHEHEGHEVPWTAMGMPFYHVQAYRRSHEREPADHGIVRMSAFEDGPPSGDNGAWTFEVVS